MDVFNMSMAMWRMAWFSGVSRQRSLLIELALGTPTAAVIGIWLALSTVLSSPSVISRMNFVLVSLLIGRDYPRSVVTADRAGAPWALTR